MRRAACLAVLFLFPFLSCYGQVYHIYRPVAETLSDVSVVEGKRRPWFGLEVAGVASAGIIKDKEDATLSRLMYGVRGTLWWHANDYLSVGIDAEKLQQHGSWPEVLEPLHRTSVAGLIKWTLTPNTEPKIYLLGGVERSKYTTAFELQHNDLNGSSTSWIAGAGGELRLIWGLKIGVQYRFVYDEKRWETFVLDGPHFRDEFSAGISYWF